MVDYGDSMAGWEPTERHRLRKGAVRTRVSEVIDAALGFTLHHSLPLSAVS
jgi:hypothetical protein